MKATVRLFARLAELAGTREAELDLGEGLRASDIYALLCSRYPGLSGFEHSLMYSINAEYVTGDHPIHDGDDVALIPPVSGGACAF